MEFKKSKNAQSMIVSTVLLILIVVALGVLILNFAVPFVKNTLSDTSCLNTVGKLSFTNHPTYTCYDPTGGVGLEEVLLQVHLGDFDEPLTGFIITLGGAATQSFEITEGGTDPDVKMFGDVAFGGPLQLPGRNEERTYIILSTLPSIIELYPLLADGKSCDATDTIDSLSVCPVP